MPPSVSITWPVRTITRRTPAASTSCAAFSHSTQTEASKLLPGALVSSSVSSPRLP